jgi:pimeloyl-ACP methyl ester carboxylesterase
MKSFFVSVVGVLFCSLALATAKPTNQFQGFVKISADRELYVDWNYAQPGKPTVVLLNGLTYSTVQWEEFTQALVGKGIGVLRYDAFGMGQTLLKYAPILAPITIEDQAKDLKRLLTKVNLPKPYNLVGLSYGGGLAFAFAEKHTADIGNLIAMSPFTEPLASQDTWIKSQVWYTRQVQPWNPYSDDELYDFFLKQIVYTTYPSAEPIVLENPYKLEAVFRMTQGIRQFLSSASFPFLPPKSFHLMIAGKDQYIPRPLLEKFWEKSPESSRATKLVINNSDHKIPESVPHFAAAWVQLIVEKNPVLDNAIVYQADAETGEVSYIGGKFKVQKEK